MRITRRLLLFLVLGAIVNVAVAWGFVAIQQDRMSRRVGMFDDVFQLRFRLVGGGLRIPETDQTYGGGNMGLVYVQRLERSRFDATNSLDAAFSSALSAGWPTCCATTGWKAKGEVADSLHSGSALLKALPTQPIWPGFAINTIFYAAILWLLLAAPFALRRRRRIKRGLCPACAYPIGESPACTECGLSIPQNSRSVTSCAPLTP